MAIFFGKRRLATRLLGIQKTLATNRNAFLLSLQDQLSDKFNQILQWEEELWAMKARTNWLIAGERNTSYFHLSTIVRRLANRISCVKLENDEWIYNVDQTKHYFREGFLKLYTTESLLNTRDMTLEMACCRLSAHEAVELASIPSNVEILVALKSMKPYKASGPNCLHAGFFQRHWSCVGDSVKDEVRNIFLSCEMPAFLNQTLIALIPK